MVYDGVCKFAPSLLTTFSYGDAFGLPEEHVEFCANAGMKAMALTEHGNVSSHVQLERACVKFGIKAIFGLEGYIAPPLQKRKCHQTILASTQEGYSNLNKLVVESWKTLGTTSKTRFPTISLELLKEYSDGLILGSGCSDSVVSCTLLGGKSYGDQRLIYTKSQYRDTIRMVQWYQEVFGDRYYLECQRFPQLARCRALNTAFEQLSADTGVPLVVTSDCHTVFDRDSEIRKILHAANRGASVEQVEASWEYDVPCGIPGTDELVMEDLEKTGLSYNAATEALLNTGRIADRCNVVLQKVTPIKYPISEQDWEPWTRLQTT